MTDTPEVSMDIETAGTSAGYMVVNIGAIYFNRQTGQFGERFDVSLDVQDLEAKGYRKDPRTMEWWESQPDGVREHCWAGVVPVADALQRLHDFLVPCEQLDGRIWVRGEHLDIGMLEFMYDVENIQIPWHYSAPRDIRTFETLLNDIGIDSDLGVRHAGVAHVGIDDAIHQAKWLIAATAVLRDRILPVEFEA